MSPRTEQELLDATIDLATHCRWSVHHDRPARRAGAKWATAIQGHAGFPDIVLARSGVVLFRELKSDKGRLSSEQRDWARQLEPGWLEMPGHVPALEGELAVLFDVWRPADWVTRIVPTLTARPQRVAS